VEGHASDLSPRESRAAIAAEQDAAAGGRDARRVALVSGRTATASVALGGRRDDGTYAATLRFKHGGRTDRRSIGRVSGASRAEALREAWRLAKEKNLLVE
jgi:DNA mismatch endonuclease, patch repair protein